MAKTNVVQFLREVRQEAVKVTWPPRRETMISTALVIAMVLLASVFFFVVDQVLSWAVRALLLL